MSRAFLAMLRTARPSSSATTFSSTLRQNAARSQRRLNSTQPTQKTQDGLAKAQEKAQESLAAAEKGLKQALDVAKKVGGGVGERAGSMLGSYREPLTYNFSVGRELLKQVYLAERLQPPTSFSTITKAYQEIWQRVSSQTYWREILRTGEYKRVGVYALEAYGIFKVGEILGRRHLVGYKLD